MKRFMLATALTCILSFSALAGEMPTCGVLGATTNPGEMPTVPGEMQSPPASALVETLILAVSTWP